MENKNTLIGTVLLGILVAGMFYYQSLSDKNSPKTKTTSTLTDSTKEGTTSPLTAEKLTESTITSLDSSTQTIEQKTFILENEKLKVAFSNRGGTANTVEIKDYKTWDKKPLILFTEKSSKFGYIVSIGGKKVNTANLFFESKQEGNNLTFSSKAPTGEQIEQTYTLKDDYKLAYTLKVNGISQPITLDWTSQLLNLEHSVTTERTYSALYYKFKEGKVEHLDEAKDKDEAKTDKSIEWISFKQQFFNATLVTNGAVKKSTFNTSHDKEKTNYVKNYRADGMLVTTNGSAEYKMEWVYSPNRFGSLKTLANDLQSIVKLSPDNFVFSWIKYITQIFTIPTFNILEKGGLNYGLIILILTIILKLVLTPLTWSSIKSSAFMKVLKPEIDELKVKYGDDQQKISAEQMKIYQTAGVNPFGGCLPMLLQMPILISMYYFFPNSIELRQQPFLWANDLSSYDAIYTFKDAIFGQNHISLFTILMTLTSIAMAAYTQANSGMTNSQPGMQYLPYIMPLFLMVMFNSFPAALTYYYLLQNVISMGQQWAIQKFFIDEAAIHKKIQDNKKAPKEKSKWMQKLEDIQKQQAETKATQKKK